VPVAPVSPAREGPYSVEGEVFAFATGVIGGASIDLWVQQRKTGYSYWSVNGPLASDGIGRFTAEDLPASQITIKAGAVGHVQPCAVRAQVPSEVPIRVEMIPISTLDVLNAPRPQLSTEPSVTGIVIEHTVDGDEPVAGAYVSVEEFMDIGIADTVSDRGGRFFLCNLGKAAYVRVGKRGFGERLIGPIDSSSESQTLEIVLER
jgi:hypothetical protein